MRSESTAAGRGAARPEKLRKLAAAARTVALFGIVAVTGYQIYLLFDPQRIIDSMNIDTFQGELTSSDGARFAGWVVNSVPSALFVAAMIDVRTLFAHLARGSVFSLETTYLLRRIGQIAVAAGVTAFVGRTLTVLVLTIGSPGAPHFVIGIGSEEITAVVVGLVLLAFGLVMQEALAIQEENKGFV